MDPELRIAPMVLVLGVTGPVIRHADAADESDLAVDDENLAVRAVVRFFQLEPLRAVEFRDVAAGAPQPLHVFVGHRARSKGIDNQIHLHAAAGGGLEATGEFLRHDAFLKM